MKPHFLIGAILCLAETAFAAPVRSKIQPSGRRHSPVGLIPSKLLPNSPNVNTLPNSLEFRAEWREESAAFPIMSLSIKGDRQFLEIEEMPHLMKFDLRRTAEEGYFLIDVRLDLIGNVLNESKRRAVFFLPYWNGFTTVKPRIGDYCGLSTDVYIFLVLLEWKVGRPIYDGRGFAQPRILAFCKVVHEGENAAGSTSSLRGGGEQSTMDVVSVSGRVCKVNGPAASVATEVISFKKYLNREPNPFLEDDESVLMMCSRGKCIIYNRRPEEGDRKIEFKMPEGNISLRTINNATVKPAVLPSAKYVVWSQPTWLVSSQQSQRTLEVTQWQKFSKFGLDPKCIEKGYFLIDVRPNLIGNDPNESKRPAVFILPDSNGGNIAEPHFSGGNQSNGDVMYLVLLEWKVGRRIYPNYNDIFKTATVKAFCRVVHDGGLTNSRRGGGEQSTMEVLSVVDRVCKVNGAAASVATEVISFKKDLNRELNPFLKNHESVLMRCSRDKCITYFHRNTRSSAGEDHEFQIARTTFSLSIKINMCPLVRIPSRPFG